VEYHGKIVGSEEAERQEGYSSKSGTGPTIDEKPEQKPPIMPLNFRFNLYQRLFLFGFGVLFLVLSFAHLDHKGIGSSGWWVGFIPSVACFLIAFHEKTRK
jgi:hypothetical protein